MTLRNQTRILTAITVIVMTIVLYLISEFMIRQAFEHLQNRYVTDQVESVLGTLSSELSNLDAITSDWAAWDDAHTFMEIQTPSFLDSNIQPPVMTNLHLSALLLVDLKGKIVTSMGYDLKAGKTIPISEALLALLKPGSPLLSHAESHNHVSGLLPLPDGPVLISSHPIVSSSYEGPIRGSMIFVRQLGTLENQAQAEIRGSGTRITLTSRPSSSPFHTLERKNVSGWSLIGPVEITPAPKGRSTVGKACIADLFGNPSVMLAVEVNDNLRSESLRLLSLMALCLLGTGLLFGTMQSVLFDKKLISRVKRLVDDVALIGRGMDSTAHVTVVGSDELTQLATAINGMVDGLRQAEMSRLHNERFLQSVFDSIQDGICVLDMDLNIVRVNIWMEQMFGGNGSLIGEKCYRVFHQKEVMCEECCARITMETKESQRQQIPYEQGGAMRWFDTSSYPLWSGTGEMIGIIEYIREVTEQRRVHAELIEATEQWERTFNAVPDLIMILDESHRVLRVNKAMAERVGATCGECNNQSCHMLFHGIHSPLKGCPHLCLIEDGMPHGIELHDDHLDGDFIITVTPLFDAQNNIIGGVHVARDVTEYKKAIEAARFSQASYEAFLDAVNDVILVLDRKTGCILDVNNKFELMFGYSREQAKRMTLNDLDADSENTRQGGDIWFEAIVAGDMQLYEWQAKHRSGNTFWVEANGRKTVQGGLERIFISIRDITMRRHEHEELLRIRSALDDCGSAVFIMDKNRRGLYLNAALGTLFGFVPDEAEDAFLPFAEDNTRQEIYTAVFDGVSWQGEIEMIARGGRRFPALLRATPVLGEDYDVIGAMFILNDVSASKYLEAQLLQAQNMKSIGQLAAGIAHEINTPMQYIGDNTRFLRDNFSAVLDLIAEYEKMVCSLDAATLSPSMLQVLEAARKKADIEYVREDVPVAIRQSLEGIDRVIEIVRAMRQLTHPGTKDQSLADLNMLVSSAVTITRNEWKYLAEIETNLNPNLPMVSCFPNDLSQVLLNLIVNASHAIAGVISPDNGQKGKITISTLSEGVFAEIRVADTGGGIPEEIRERIFDPFFTTKEAGKGTGQGLAISHAIVVEKHGGILAFESEVGVGSTFIIRLPLRNVAK